MDYGHSKKPVEQIRTGLTEEERSFMKRKSEGPKTDEELFHEFLKWKKSKTDTTDTKDEQEGNVIDWCLAAIFQLYRDIS